MNTTQGPAPKPPVGPLFGADEAANLSLLFDPAAAATDAAAGHGPDRRDEVPAAPAAGAQSVLGWLRPVRSAARF